MNPSYVELLNLSRDLKDRGLQAYKCDGHVELPFASGLLVCPLCHEHFVQGEIALCFLARHIGGQEDLKLFVHERCYKRLRSKINKIRNRRRKLENKMR